MLARTRSAEPEPGERAGRRRPRRVRPARAGRPREGGAALALLAAAFALTLWVSPWDAEQVTDLPIYAAYADLFLDGSLPYRDVAFEYPPLAAPLLALAGVGGTDYDTYRSRSPRSRSCSRPPRCCCAARHRGPHRRVAAARDVRHRARAAAHRGDDPHALRPLPGRSRARRARAARRRPAARRAGGARAGRRGEGLPARRGAGRARLAARPRRAGATRSTARCACAAGGRRRSCSRRVALSPCGRVGRRRSYHLDRPPQIESVPGVAAARARRRWGREAPTWSPASSRRASCTRPATPRDRLQRRC